MITCSIRKFSSHLFELFLEPLEFTKRSNWLLMFAIVSLTPYPTKSIQLSSKHWTLKANDFCLLWFMSIQTYDFPVAHHFSLFFLNWFKCTFYILNHRFIKWLFQFNGSFDVNNNFILDSFWHSSIFISTVFNSLQL